MAGTQHVQMVFQIVNFGINKAGISKNQQTFLEGNSRELLQFS